MQIPLTYQEKSTLESRHKKCSDKRECDRIKVILLSDEGWSTMMISQALRKHQTSIIRHLNDYASHQKMMVQIVTSMMHKPNWLLNI